MQGAKDVTPTADITPPEWTDIFHAIRQPTLILSPSHIILSANHTALKALKVTEEEVIGRHCHEFFHNSDEVPDGCPLVTLLESGDYESNDMEVEALGGTYLVSCTPVTGSSGDIVRIIHIATDITKRKEAQEELKATAQAATLYLDLLGHDIRNHLQAITIGSDLIERYDCEPDVALVTALLKQVISRTQSLITKVQDTRDLLSTPLTPIDLRAILQECIERLKQRFPDIEVSLNIDTEDAIVLADEYISNLVDNLLENAVIHNANITKQVWVSLIQTEDGFRVVIEDNGLGIDDDRKRTLLDPTRRFGGVGLQQAVRIAEKYCGLVDISDRIPGDSDKGSKFRIWFPKRNVDN
ncbi:MAG: PAS domain-containing sensor histidine kinase [Candidatus Thorarchaeota archaeon]